MCVREREERNKAIEWDMDRILLFNVVQTWKSFLLPPAPFTQMYVDSGAYRMMGGYIIM